MEFQLIYPNLRNSVGYAFNDQHLIRFGDSLLIYLDIIFQLSECVSWIEDVDAALLKPEKSDGSANEEEEPLEKLTLEELCELQLRGGTVAAAVTYTSVAVVEDPTVPPTSPTESSVLDIALSKATRRLLDVIGQARSIDEAMQKMIESE